MDLKKWIQRLGFVTILSISISISVIGLGASISTNVYATPNNNDIYNVLEEKYIELQAEYDDLKVKYDSLESEHLQLLDTIALEEVEIEVNNAENNAENTIKVEAKNVNAVGNTPNKNKNAETETNNTTEDVIENNVPSEKDHLNSYDGTFNGPSGKETYYNLDMNGVIDIMRNMGYSEEEYPYWIREDGCKMFGDYIMVAADLKTRPKGTIIETSLGTAMVVDTGDFAKTNPTQIDIATNW